MTAADLIRLLETAPPDADVVTCERLEPIDTVEIITEPWSPHQRGFRPYILLHEGCK